MTSASAEDYMRTAQTLLTEAEQNDICLRLVGSMAFRVHCDHHSAYFDALERELTDIDFVAPKADRRKLRSFFEQRGYIEDRDVLIAAEGSRYFYTDPKNGVGIDAFIDRLDYCHLVDLHDRMTLDSPTVPLADLVLQKLQIVEINERDIKDLIVCFVEHEIGVGDREMIDGVYIADLLAKDWGFFHTAMMNTERVLQFIDRYTVLDEQDRATAAARITQLRGLVEGAPKSLRWKARAKIGTKVRWYNEVNEKESTF